MSDNIIKFLKELGEKELTWFITTSANSPYHLAGQIRTKKYLKWMKEWVITCPICAINKEDYGLLWMHSIHYGLVKLSIEEGDLIQKSADFSDGPYRQELLKACKLS